MPNCVRFTLKGSKTEISFHRVDEMLCERLGLTVSDTQWGGGQYDWYNTIAFGLALGHDWDKLREIYKNQPNVVEDITWFEENFSTDTWWEGRSRG